MTLRIADAGTSDPDVPWPDVYFSRAYGRAEEARQAGTWLSLVGCDGNWQLPLLKRPIDGGYWDAVSPYGYAGIFAHPDLSDADCRDIAAEAVTWLADEGCVAVFVRESPVIARSQLPLTSVPIVRSHPIRVVPLTDAETMWSAAEGRARTAIRKAEKAGLVGRVRPTSPGEFCKGEPGFRTLYDATMQRLNAGKAYSFRDPYYLTLQAELGEDLRVAEVVNPNGTTVAAALLMTHGLIQHYHLSGSDPAAARLGANNLLLWEAMTFGAHRGSQNFVLGGGLSGEDTLYRFKKSFGGTAANFQATGYVVNAAIFDEQIAKAARRHRVQPESLTARGYFPAYRSLDYA